MKIGDRVLVYPHPFQPHMAPTLGIVTRVHGTGWIDVTMFFDVDTIRDLSLPPIKAVGPMRVFDEPATIPGYRNGYFAVVLDARPVAIEAGSCATIAAPPAALEPAEVAPEALGIAPPPSRTDAPRQRPRHATAR